MKKQSMGNPSLEFVLDKFPQEVRLKGGTSCVIRPLQRKDASRLHKFLLEVPELEHLFIKERVEEKRKVEEWCENIDFEENMTLLMLLGNRVVGEGNIHLRQGGWKRHVGLLTLLTHPDFRGKDISRILAEALVELGRHLGLKKLEAELNGERENAIRSLQTVGFTEHCRIANHVLDMEGKPHDYVLLSMKITTDEEFASAVG